MPLATTIAGPAISSGTNIAITERKTRRPARRGINRIEKNVGLRLASERA
jgi:hypothetical protein